MGVVYTKYPFIEDENLSREVLSKVPGKHFIVETDSVSFGPTVLSAVLANVMSLSDEKIVFVFPSIASRYVEIPKNERMVTVFLNHGWGTKLVPSVRAAEESLELRVCAAARKFTDYIICYSEFDGTYFLQHPLLNGLPLPKFVPLGHPRNDFIVQNKNNSNYKMEIRKKLAVSENSKVFLIAPTFRDFLKDYNEEIVKLYETELEELSKMLDERTYVLYRPHHYLGLNVQKSRWSNVIICDAKTFPDPRPLMLASDILVTDYSSIFVDFLLLDRRIVFFQPDLQKYQKVRGLAIDPNNKIHMPGPKINHLSELLELSENDFAEYNLEESKRFFHKYSDANATNRFAKFLTEILQKGVRP